MKIKNMREFRTWFKKEFKQTTEQNRDEHFIGNEFVKKDNKKVFGFFELYHGYKPNIANSLMDGLKNAQDGQAIYEFIQNAADCESDYFAIFYNENYFLAINNGTPFSQKDINSILNANQSSKTDNTGQAVDCGKIGRFGIGFKLVHRLVGENDGMSELTRDYKGPIIFSWSEKNHIQALQEFKPNQTQLEFNENAPYLFKILITNFPAMPNEIVKNINYEDAILFKNEELNEFVTYFQSIQNELNIENLQKGSMFFLKLGKNKKKLLDDQYKSLISGVKCGLNHLKTLKTINIQSTEIQKLDLKLIDFTINNNEIVTPEDQLCPVKMSFGYLSNYKKGIEELRASPNFYKYFPMSKENHGLNFIFHSTAFRIKTDRTQLEEDKDNTNSSIFQVFWQYFEPKLQEIKEKNPQEFKNIYTNLLVSKSLLDENGNKKWLYNTFYLPLLDFLKNNIPTKNNQFSNNPKNVKIKNFNLDIDLNAIGLGHIQWFEWESKNDEELTKESISEKKLDLDVWDIGDILENANIEKLNLWISQQDQKSYENFLSEIQKKSLYLKKETEKILPNIRFFKFSNGEFYSLEDIKKYSNVFFTTQKLAKITSELGKIGFVVSNKNIEEHKKFFDIFSPFLPKDKDIFAKIEIKLDKNTLSNKEKKNLFLNLCQFDNVGEVALQKINLFNNQNQEQKSLKSLLNPNLILPKWLEKYKIDKNEYFAELDKYLLQENEIYSEIILKNWETLKDDFDASQIKNEYQKIIKYFNLSENKTPFNTTQNFIFIDKEQGFLNTKNVFFNEFFAKITNYKYFQTGIFTLTDAYTPAKEILEFLTKEPFNLKDENFKDFGIENESELFLEELKEVIAFCEENREDFFQYCIIEKNDNTFTIFEKTKKLFQIISAEKAKSFIENNLPNSFKILPSEFGAYKESKFILQGENVWTEILKQIDIDKFAEELVDIIAYSKNKRIFLLEISEIILETQKKYTKNSFEYKLLAIACDEKVLTENDYPNFRKNIIIKNQDEKHYLSNIPPFADKIKLGDSELSLAKILPNDYANNSFLGDIITHFEDLGLDTKQLKKVFGIKNEVDIEQIFEIFKHTKVLENAHQLAFFLLYDKEIKPLDFSKIEVETLEDNYSLLYDFYTKKYSFISEDAILSKKYKGLKDILKLPFEFNKENRILKNPYFTKNTFVCPYLKPELNISEKIDFLNFLFEKWKIKENQTQIQKIDWSEINDTETKKILGFNPELSVFPNKYALEKEYLPEYTQNWLIDNEEKINFLADLGVKNENSLLVKLRKYFNKESKFSKFDIPKIQNTDLIFNTLEFLKINKLKAQNEQGFEILENLVEFFNENQSEKRLKKRSEFDFDILVEKSKELDTTQYGNWLTEIDNEFKIYHFDGKMPKNVYYGIYGHYIFYSFNEGNFCIDEDNKIFINKNAKLKSILRELAEDKENEFTERHLNLFYEANQNEIPDNIDVTQVLGENETLKQKLNELETKLQKYELQEYEKILRENANLKARIEAEAKTASSSPTTTKDEYFDEIKEKSEKLAFEQLKKDFSNQVVKWLNFDERTKMFRENYAQHDFEILDKNGNILYYIDAKGTPDKKTTFYLTSDEWHFFLENKEKYKIYRVFGVDNIPNIKSFDLWESIQNGEIMPYLNATENILAKRVFLTIL